MKKINSFINQYPISKTLRFSLIPIGKTEENFNNAQLLETDKLRAEKYHRVKKYMDRYHKYFINDIMHHLKLENIKEYAELYFKANKTENELKAMASLEEKLRKSIAVSFSKDSRYNHLFKKEMIEEILPSFLTLEAEISDVEAFYGFTTYFTGFYKNRENMYSAEAQTTAISYRCINENLPRFLDNVKRFELIKDVLPAEAIHDLNERVFRSAGVELEDVFSADYYTFVLSQTDIDRYNNIIGGYVDESGNKVRGINEYINLYNQQNTAKDKLKRLPVFTALYKQILSDRTSVSFIPEKFSDDNVLLTAVNDFYIHVLSECLDELSRLFDNIGSYNFDGIFVSNNAKNEFSHAVFGRWDAISEGWRAEYRRLVPLKSNRSIEKYNEKMEKALKQKLSFSLSELQKLGEPFKAEDCPGNIAAYLQNTVAEKIKIIKADYSEAKSLLTEEYKANNDRELRKNESAVALLKNLLDSIKDLEQILKGLKGTGKEENKDFSFYGDFINCYEALSSVDGLYDKVRNYVTQKRKVVK